VDTEVSKQSNVGRDETMVGSCKVVVGHSGAVNVGPKKSKTELEPNPTRMSAIFISVTGNTLREDVQTVLT